METLEMKDLLELGQTEVQQMNGGMYMLTDQSSYNAQLQANNMIISFIGGFIVGLFS